MFAKKIYNLYYWVNYEWLWSKPVKPVIDYYLLAINKISN